MSPPPLVEHLRDLLRQGRFPAHRAALKSALRQIAEGMVEGRLLPRAEAASLTEDLATFAFTESLPALARAAPVEADRLRETLDALGAPTPVRADVHDRILTALQRAHRPRTNPLPLGNLEEDRSHPLPPRA